VEFTASKYFPSPNTLLPPGYLTDTDKRLIEFIVLMWLKNKGVKTQEKKLFFANIFPLADLRDPPPPTPEPSPAPAQVAQPEPAVSAAAKQPPRASRLKSLFQPKSQSPASKSPSPAPQQPRQRSSIFQGSLFQKSPAKKEKENFPEISEEKQPPVKSRASIFQGILPQRRNPTPSNPEQQQSQQRETNDENCVLM
jgi:hypothetical protein